MHPNQILTNAKHFKLRLTLVVGPTMHHYHIQRYCLYVRKYECWIGVGLSNFWSINQSHNLHVAERSITQLYHAFLHMHRSLYSLIDFDGWWRQLYEMRVLMHAWNKRRRHHGRVHRCKFHSCSFAHISRRIRIRRTETNCYHAHSLTHKACVMLCVKRQYVLRPMCRSVQHVIANFFAFTWVILVYLVIFPLFSCIIICWNQNEFRNWCCLKSQTWDSQKYDFGKQV